MNLGTFFGTLLPGSVRGFRTDGSQLFDLLLGGPGAERDLLASLLTGASLEGVRPRDWDAGRVERMLALREHRSRDVHANLLGYYYALDHGRVEQAGELLDLVLGQMRCYPAISRWEVRLEAAFFEAWHRGRASVARNWLQQVKPDQAHPCKLLRAEAAVLFAEGHYEEAIARGVVGLMSGLSPIGEFRLAMDGLCAVLAESRRRLSPQKERAAPGENGTGTDLEVP
jgi:hypothetical protein